MPFFKSLPDESGPGAVFSKYPEIYGHWAQMGQALINGPSPLTPGERELIQAYVAGVADCRYAFVAHSAAAVAWGIEQGLVEKMLQNLDTAPIENRFKPLFEYIRKLTLAPASVTQSDANAVFAVGWDEKGLHDAIAVTARMNFMCRIVQGHGFIPMSQERAKAQAEKRKQAGYVELYPAFAGEKEA